MDDLSEPLSEEELDWLDEFLLYRIDEDADCEGKDEGVIDIAGLDGLLTAVVSGPVVVPPSIWLPAIWGDFQPIWESEKVFSSILNLFVRHMNSISSLLMSQPDAFEPLFYERSVKDKTYTIFDEWCEGYMRGVALAADAWDRNSIEMKILLAPIAAFTREQNFIGHDQCTARETENLQKAIAPNVREIHRYWLERRADNVPVGTVKRDQPKTGRNDPCPCGSGKKLKKCCLH
jgi:uncharacterized protein